MQQRGALRWALGWACGVVMLVGCSAGSAALPTSSVSVSPVPVAPTSALAASSSGPAVTLGPSAVASPAASPAPSGNLTPLRVSYGNPAMDELPVWIAFDEGIFQQHGLDVDLEFVSSATQMDALLSGDIDIAQPGGGEVLSSITNGASITMLTDIMPQSPSIFMVSADITSPDQLRGKAIGTGAPGGAADIGLRLLLPKIGLQPDQDVTLVRFPDSGTTNAALANGAIQGALANPLAKQQFEALGLHELFDLVDLNIPQAENVTAVQSSFLATHKDVVQAYVDSLMEAIAREKADKALSVQLSEKYLKSTDETAIATAYDTYAQKILPDQPYLTDDQFTGLMQVLGATNPQIAELSVDNYIDNSFVQSAVERQVGSS